jgi:hypothetical protein
MDAPKSIRETDKNPKNPLVWAKKPQKTQKNPKNPKKPKKPKKTHWAGFFLKNPGFFQPCEAQDPLESLSSGGVPSSLIGELKIILKNFNVDYKLQGLERAE